MIICGIKLTHDGAIALIDNGKLIFSYEMEKLDNQARHSDFCIGLTRMEEILAEHGYSLAAVDRLVIDGWDGWKAEDIGSGKAQEQFRINISWDGRSQPQAYDVADYGHFVKASEDILQPFSFDIKELGMRYNSYKHVSGHVFGGYCSSPFAKRGEDAFILVWDGGMPPQLFYYNYTDNKVQNLGHLFLLSGYLYINFSHAFEPFCQLKKSLSIAGKAMAYMAFGKVDPEILDKYRSIFDNLKNTVNDVEPNIDIVAILTAEFIKQAKEFVDEKKLSHQDVLTTFQAFVQELLIDGLRKKVATLPNATNNLCFTGGSGLNIKWNSSIRGSGIFKEMWVPPFPNDAGSAIGTACCEMILNDGIKALEWNVYSGPFIRETPLQKSRYAVQDCSLEELAEILHKYNEPIVFLNGPAELGPRALGNRSILAAAVSPTMKKTLNTIKGREDYRPVAPICIEEDAAEVFTPGFPDPYMLFEHWVREEWKEKVPAICHLDGTARLQTVNEKENPFIYELLTQYKKLSGVPLLCNTSANFNGSGFFPDVKSVMEWDKVNFIWSDGKLYFKKEVLQPDTATSHMQVL